MINENSNAIVTKRFTSSQYTDALNNRCKKKQRSRNINVHTREKRFEEQITSDETDRKRDQRLIRTKKDFVKRLTQERMRE